MASTPGACIGPLPLVGTSNDGVLPQDLLYEILLRLPAKSVCRFRAVCTSWHFLLCHDDFIAAHQHHNPPKHLAVAVFGLESLPGALMDLDSGCVIRTESTSCHADHSPQPLQEMPALSPSRVVCVVGMDRRVSLMDFATRALFLLPDHGTPGGYTTISYTLGHAASTGEYKVLAIAHAVVDHLLHPQQRQICKILTVGGRNCDGGHHWRRIGSPRCRVILPPHNMETTIIKGVAYFLVSINGLAYNNPELDMHHAWILAFNLDSEAWRPAPIQGPTDFRGIGLAGLDGHLVAFHDDHRACVKLWYLADPDHDVWSMLHQIVMPYHRSPLPSPISPVRYHEYFEKPLTVLEDGRIVVCMRVHADMVLRICDPRTGAFTDGTRVANCYNMGVHKFSILYTGRGCVLK